VRDRLRARRMTGDLVLVRHAPTRLEEGVPSAAWELAPGARELTSQLAARLAALPLAAPGAGALGGIDAVVTSHEPKAVGTGRVLAAELGVPASTAPDLEEHHRAGRRLMDEAEWQRTLKRFFANPDVLLFGTETGARSEEHTSELQSRENLVCRLLLEKKKKKKHTRKQ